MQEHTEDHRPAPVQTAQPPGPVGRQPADAPSTNATSETSFSSGPLSQQSLTFGLSDASAAAADPLIGVTVGDITIDRLLAEGGMGRVYLGTQQRPSRTVAVKFMRHGHSATALERFHREAEVLGRLSHPGIARVFFTDSVQVGLDRVPCSVMEYVPDAETLIRFCNQKQLSLHQKLELFVQVCDAVAYGHAQGVVHRDLKPGNILATDEHGTTDPRTSVIDYGIAKVLEKGGQDGMTATGEFLGTRQYMSPEQLSGNQNQVDVRSDVYALGVVLHELLTGKLPYDLVGKSLPETLSIVTRTKPRRLDVRDPSLTLVQRTSLAEIVARCLEKTPTERYETAAGLAADLRRMLDGLRVSHRRRHSRMAGLLLGVVVALTAVGFLTQHSIFSRLFSIRSQRSATAGGLTAKLTDMPATRSSPLEWLMVSFSSQVNDLSRKNLQLTHNGLPVALDGVTITPEGPNEWRLSGLTSANEQEGDYVFSLLAGEDSPRGGNGQTLSEPIIKTWSMPSYRVWKLTPLLDSWQEHLVSMDSIEPYTEEDAGVDSFFKPTVNGQEGAIVFRFQTPFPIRFAELTSLTIVWTTGDPFPYDPGARASIDVSADGVTWTEIDTREAGRGGRFFTPTDISDVVAGSKEVWVRARLEATVEWPLDGLIHSQFMRTSQANLENGSYPFVLQVSATPRVGPAGSVGLPVQVAPDRASRLDASPSAIRSPPAASIAAPLLGQLPSLPSVGRVQLAPDASRAVVNADVGQLCFIDVPSPQSMLLVSEFRRNGFGGFRDFTWSPDGTKLYAITHKPLGGLHIIDVTAFSSPVETGFLRTPDYAHEVALSPDGNTVFVADGNTGLLAIDVSRPEAPATLGELSLSTFVQGGTLSADGKLCFLPCYQDGLNVVDVSNPARMFRLGRVALPGNAWRITRSPDDAILYVITREQGFCVVDVSDPTQPKLRSEVTRLSNIDRLIVSDDGQRLYAMLRDQGIWTFDISSPALPHLFRTQPLAGRPIDLALLPSTNTALVCALDRGLVALQLNGGQPLEPTQK